MKLKAFIIFTFLFAAGCKRSIDPILFGKDACENCKMSIVDQRFASAFMNDHGKTYKFDDIQCLISYIHRNNFDESKLTIFVSQFDNNHLMIDAKSAYYLYDENFKSPMNGNLAGFKDETSSSPFLQLKSSSLKRWGDLQ
jgi:copper chaperone NosL